MLVTIAEAARFKICSENAVRSALSSGVISAHGDSVQWDRDFETWVPEVPVQRVVSFLNQRRFDAKAIVKPVGSKPIPLLFESAQRFKKSMSGFDWLVIPITLDNFGILFRSQDGYFDAQVYHPEAEKEFVDHLSQGLGLYQIRVGVPTERYAGKNLYPSGLSTTTAIASLKSVEESTLLDQQADLTTCSYRGATIIIQDRHYEGWESRIATERESARESAGSPHGRRLEYAFF